MPGIIHLVPSFHYDVGYVCPEDSYLEICYDILREALRLLRTNEDYTFRIEQTFMLERFIQEYPSLLPELKEFAKSGRLELSPGSFCTPDLNIPSGESLIRNCVIGKRWSEKYLGAQAEVLDVGDSFGVPVQFPQIACICGYKFCTLFRAIDDMNRKCEISWQALDGTTMPTYWLSGIGYAGWCEGYGPEFLEDLVKLVNKHGSSNIKILSHGGDFQYPYELGSDMISSWNSYHRASKLQYSTYIKSLEQIDFSEAPIETCEWNPMFQGTYSSRIRIKQDNRDSEALLFTAEAISAYASITQGIPIDQEGLDRAWKLALTNQNHDILCGTISDIVYQHARERADRVRMICGNIIDDNLNTLCPVNEDKRTITVFNPLPWPRRCKITANASAGEKIIGAAPVLSRDRKLTTWVDLPACGMNVLSVSEPEETCSYAPGVSINSKVFKINQLVSGGIELETPIYSVYFSSWGSIVGLMDKNKKLEYAEPGSLGFNVLCCQTDHGDLWQYYEGPFRDGGKHAWESECIDDPFPDTSKTYSRNGRRQISEAFLSSDVDYSVDEISEEHIVILITGSLCRKNPNFQYFTEEPVRIDWESRVTFHASDPKIEFELKTHHIAGSYYRLRTAFAFGIQDGTILHEVPFGVLERSEGEYPAQNWMAYGNNERAIALLNYGLPGNNVTDGVMMLSLMRSVDFATRAESKQALEQGEHMVFNYALVPFAGIAELDKTELSKLGMEMAVKPYILDSSIKTDRTRSRKPVEPPSNTLPDSLVSLTGEGISCSAIYIDKERLVLRLWNSTNSPKSTSLNFGFNIASAFETDAINSYEQDLQHEASSLTVDLEAFEIKTISIASR